MKHFNCWCVSSIPEVGGRIPSTQHDLIREGLNLDFLEPLISVYFSNYIGHLWTDRGHKAGFKSYLN
jgi:hypothetical protein